VGRLAQVDLLELEQVARRVLDLAGLVLRLALRGWFRLQIVFGRDNPVLI
jgi:hypothetical protein